MRESAKDCLWNDIRITVSVSVAWIFWSILTKTVALFLPPLRGVTDTAGYRGLSPPANIGLALRANIAATVFLKMLFSWIMLLLVLIV